jgi:hypothetical protein
MVDRCREWIWSPYSYFVLQSKESQAQEKVTTGGGRRARDIGLRSARNVLQKAAATNSRHLIN